MSEARQNIGAEEAQHAAAARELTETAGPRGRESLERILQAGLALIPIPYGRKGPAIAGWNTRAACITDPARAGELAGQNAGLAHAYSGTCALDIDNFQAAAAYLQGKGIDLAQLCMADDAVQVRSGSPNRAKLLFRIPEPLRTVQISPDGAVMLEFRCATADGLTVQDVVYGTHPSGSEYQLLGNPAAIPPINPALHELWQQQLHRESTQFPHSTTFTGVLPATQAAELREALAFLDADSREQWVEVGAALHVYGEQGYEIWTTWSQRSEKFNLADQRRVWNSFRDDRPGVTIRTLFAKAMRAGWANPLSGRSW